LAEAVILITNSPVLSIANEVSASFHSYKLPPGAKGKSSF